MAKVHEVKPGFEREFDLVVEKKGKLNEEKELAIKKAIEEVDLLFAEREKTINDLLSIITVEVEEPEEEVEEMVEPETLEEVSEVVSEPADQVLSENSQEVQPSPMPGIFGNPNQRLGF